MSVNNPQNHQFTIINHQSAPQASIIILTYNNLDYTRQCLESIFQKTTSPPYEIIVVDNASTDDTPNYLRDIAAEHPNVRLILNTDNKGFAAGNNQGAALAAGDYLVFLNNDTIVTWGWLEGLIRHLQDPHQRGQVGMVGPVTNSSGNETRIPVEYSITPGLEGLDEFAESYTRTHQGRSFEIRMLALLCVALRRSVFDEVGPLDERFGIGMFEDDDYAIRLKEKGYKLICAEDVFIHHWGSASFSRLGAPQYWALFRENLSKFEAKWQLSWVPHIQRSEFIPEQMRQMLDGSLWFFETLTFREKTIADLQKYGEEQTAYINRLQEQTSYQQETITELQSERENLLTQRSDLLAQRNDLLAQRNDLQAQRDVLQNQVQLLIGQLNGIYNSNGWAFLQLLLRIRRFFIPEGSRREQWLRSLLQAARDIKRNRLSGLSRQVRNFMQSTTQPAPASSTGIDQVESTQPAISAPLITQETRGWAYPAFSWPLVSVIIPVYNHADMLEGAAHSVLFGTYPNIELIIIDDGSTDNIEPVLKRLLNNPRVRILRQPNQKLPRALTNASQFTQGQFVTWTSADNLLSPDALQHLVQALLAHPEAVLAYADVAIIDEQGQRLQDSSYRPQNLDQHAPGVVRLYQSSLPLGFEVDNYINACFLYRREAAQALEGCYASDLAGLEDYDFWLRMQRCGSFHHLQNSEPLYSYRVHQRTMSHDLLTKELEPHLERGRRLIVYEAERRAYAEQRWTLIPDATLPLEERLRLKEIAGLLPVDFSDHAEKSETVKQLRFVPEQTSAPEPVYVRVHGTGQRPEKYWQLVWRSTWQEDEQSLAIWRGVKIPPLAWKARQYNKNTWEFPQAGQRPMIGCHLGLAKYPIDIKSTRQMIDSNPWAFFVFIDRPLEDDPDRGQALVAGLANAAYLGVRMFGESYQLYACLDALWLPPLTEQCSEDLARTQLALAYAIARPLLLPRSVTAYPAPYQFQYDPPDDTLNAILSFSRGGMDPALLDTYLQQWTPEASLQQLLRYANAVTQETVTTRPDFGVHPAPVSAAHPWRPANVLQTAPLKCALAVESLDKGGLEEMVGQLARHLRSQGAEPFVICVQRGGMVADRLQADGIPVHIADGQRMILRDVLQKEQPAVINTQWAGKALLEVASDLGIPIVETIQNTYVWLTQEGWQSERQRSLYYSHALAVSELVKRYYLKWNPAYNAEWISIAPNGIDPSRLAEYPRTDARQELDISTHEYLFLSLASYDRRKNHLGLLSAFDQLARDYPQARLLCAGNPLDPHYYDQVSEYRDSLKSKERIHFTDFRADPGLLLSAADSFVINSFFEGWSLAATEALMAGLPLIHSECGSAHELVGMAGERGIVVPNPAAAPLSLTLELTLSIAYQHQQRNIPALIQAMAQMIEQRQDWFEKREAIRAYARQHFSLDHILEEYLRVLYRLAGLTPGTQLSQKGN